MADKLINFPKDDTQNYPFCNLQLVVDAQLNEPINQNSIKVHKVKSKQIINFTIKLWGLV